MNGNGPVGDGKAEIRKPRSIRLVDSEWQRIEAFAEARGLAAAEFVRFAALAAVADGGESIAKLAPLIKTIFRATHILASRLRAEMLGADEAEELDKLVATARRFQDELLGKASD